MCEYVFERVGSAEIAARRAYWDDSSFDIGFGKYCRTSVDDEGFIYYKSILSIFCWKDAVQEGCSKEFIDSVISYEISRYAQFYLYNEARNDGDKDSIGSTLEGLCSLYIHHLKFFDITVDMLKRYESGEGYDY